jgi:TatD DNase family protein
LAVALVDTHFHLDLSPDAAAVAERCEARQIYTIAVTNAPCVFEKTERLTRGKKYLRAALGLHPELAVERRGELAMFRSLLPRTRYIGEVGLDYGTPSASDRRIQRTIFGEILGLCSDAGDKVVTVHSRRAAEDVVDAIGPSFRGTVILHWYSGSEKVLDRAIAAGAYASVNTAMCEGKRFPSLLSRIPRDRVLTETDGPFVSVQGRKAEPTDVQGVLAALARLWGEDASEVTRLVYANFARALGQTRTASAVPGSAVLQDTEANQGWLARHPRLA